jgi:hypothetical protein
MLKNKFGNARLNCTAPKGWFFLHGIVGNADDKRRIAI